MRRWLTGIALSTVVALAPAGCTRPAGTDGDLSDDWAPMAAPAVFTPAPDTCHAQPQEVGYVGAYAPVDCDQPHRVETLHVGSLPSADTKTPPTAGSAQMRTAFAECDRQTRSALGADWRSGRVGLSVVFPSPAAWSGGARWFRCDVTELRGLDVPVPVRRTASLSGTLSGASPLRHGCFNAKTSGDEVIEMVAVKCTARHRAEFVGIWKAPKSSYKDFLDNAGRAHRGCRSLIAKFAKVPDDNNLQYRAGTIFYHPAEAEWRSGNRGVQCFLWSSERVLTRSMKGAGSRALPIT
ncbi:septum formation family protein [Micromonospora sp. NPDC051196]|uniref:septum formation family protein n=1 Tax=Micromonospora sp. NPDC051196 TaxID=3155281 RepID=UPI003438D35D